MNIYNCFWSHPKGLWWVKWPTCSCTVVCALATVASLEIKAPKMLPGMWISKWYKEWSMLLKEGTVPMLPHSCCCNLGTRLSHTCREDILHLYLTLVVMVISCCICFISCKATAPAPLCVSGLFVFWNNSSFVVKRPCASLLLSIFCMHDWLCLSVSFRCVEFLTLLTSLPLTLAS